MDDTTILGDSIAAALAAAVPEARSLCRGGINSRDFAMLLASSPPPFPSSVIVSLGANDRGTDPEPYWQQILGIVGKRPIVWLLPTNATRYVVRSLLHVAALNDVCPFDTSPYVGNDKLHIHPDSAAALVRDLRSPPSPQWAAWYARAFGVHGW